jgi:hypothetical protein
MPVHIVAPGMSGIWNTPRLARRGEPSARASRIRRTRDRTRGRILLLAAWLTRDGRAAGSHRGDLALRSLRASAGTLRRSQPRGSSSSPPGGPQCSSAKSAR